MRRRRSSPGGSTDGLCVEDKLEIGATAVIRADIVARSIAIAKGAVIEGVVTVTSGQPVVAIRGEARRPLKSRAVSAPPSASSCMRPLNGVGSTSNVEALPGRPQ